MAPERRWWNGKVAGGATITGGIIGVVSLVVIEVQTGWFDDRWDDGWPGWQLGLLCLAVLALGVALGGARRRIKRMEPEAEEAAELRRKLAAADPALLEADRRLLDEFLALLPSGCQSMYFVREHPFDVSYSDDDWRELRTFQFEWMDAEHMFHDAEAQAALEELRTASRALHVHLAQHSFVTGGSGHYRIYPDFDLDYETEENAFAVQAAREAGDLGAAVWDAHQHFVSTARRRLGR